MTQTIDTTDLGQRNYLADMNMAVDAAVPAGSWIASEQAQLLKSHLVLTDPELLRGWQDACAVVWITQLFSYRQRLNAKLAAAQVPRGRFAAAAGSFERHLDEQSTGVAAGTLGGDPSAMSIFAACIAVNADNLRRPIGQMTKADCLWVAGQYARTEKIAAAERFFFEAVADRIPDGGVVSDVFSEDEFLRLKNSLDAI